MFRDKVLGRFRAGSGRGFREGSAIRAGFQGGSGQVPWHCFRNRVRGKFSGEVPIKDVLGQLLTSGASVLRQRSGRLRGKSRQGLKVPNGLPGGPGKVLNN